MTSNHALTLFGIFFLGLGLNLTPCVYPMMTVTVSLFGGQKKTDRVHSFFHAAAYVLGIAAMYSSLGVITALTGGFFGSLLQSKWVLLGIAMVLAGLALSLFNVYTLALPSALVNKLAGRRHVGLAGFFLSGLFVGVFAAPCIGPTILALIAYVARKADPVYAFWVFFIMSLGLGLPYLLLGTFSGLLKKLPRSGTWLVWVERLLGVLLFSLAGFYLILAVRPALLPWLVPFALFAGGVYLGFLEKSAKYGPKFSTFKKITGAAAVTAALLIPAMAPRQSVNWETFTEQKLAQAKAGHKPVIIDFYAEWCIPCHELDRKTYTDPKVIQALNGFVRLKVDMTHADDPLSQDIAGRFEIVGVPTLLFLDAQGHEIEDLRVTGFIPPKEFLELLDSAPQLQRGRVD